MLTRKQRQLLHVLIDDESIPISSVKEASNTSAATVYRHLETLESLRIRNDRGTLRLVIDEHKPSASIAHRLRVNFRLKAAAGRYIAGLLARREEQCDFPGSLFLDCGSACVAVGREILRERAPHCPILTINPVVVRDFSDAPDLPILTVLRGEVDWNKGSILTSADEIRRSHFEAAVIGVDFVLPDGRVFLNTPLGFEQKQAAVEMAKHVFLPIDQTKIREAADGSGYQLDVSSASSCTLVIGADFPLPSDMKNKLEVLRAARPRYQVKVIGPNGIPIDL